MRIFDYSFLEEDKLPVSLTNQAIAIGEMRAKGSIRKEQFPNVFEKLESIAKVQSVKGSNAIEGIVSTDRRIEELVKQKSTPQNHHEYEIAGYRDALAIIHENYKNIDINERDILNLHAIMQRQNENIRGGEYKKVDNSILAVDRHGVSTVRFKPISADKTSHAMGQLILAYLSARQNSKINQSFLVPCFILDFLCIHPFLDGNGRISRLLSLLLLYKNGFDAGKYISFEQQINEHKKEYYDALYASSLLWHEGENDYVPFMQNFIQTLFACYKELDSRFSTFSTKKPKAVDRILSTINASLLPISKREISLILPDIAISTISINLNKLLKEKKIVKIGGYKNAKYKHGER